MTARSALKDLRSKLPATASAFPAPLPQRPTWTDQDRSLVAAWKAYLEWEASNPIELEDAEELQARVMYAYRKAVSGDCRFFPEIWYICLVDIISSPTLQMLTHPPQGSSPPSIVRALARPKTQQVTSDPGST